MVCKLFLLVGMDERRILRKKICILSVAGGAMVAATFIINWILGSGTWESWWFSNFLHLAGGFYAFFFVRTVFSYTKGLHQTSTAPWMEILIFIAGAIVLGVFWEWFELALDRYRVWVVGKPSLMTYADNVGDLVLDALGAAIAAIFVSRNKNAQGR